jgi:hypothetical protein
LTYPGVGQVRRFHLSIGYGQNVICTADILPQLTLPAVDGTLVVTDGTTTLNIPGCRLDEAHMTRSIHGHIVRIQILGPTWKWRLAGIDGVYNVRRPDGSIIPSTRKTTQQLATLLFQAMQVPSFDVSGLPNADGPFVNWQGAIAFNELTWLCQQWGCDFGLDVQGTVARIWRLGVGPGLPTGGTDVTQDYGIDLSEPPDRLKLYCGPTLYQSKLKLKAVMEGTDGILYDRDSVPYAPAGGWTGTDIDDPLDPDADAEERRLAKKTNLRYFLIDTQANGTWTVPGYGAVTSVEDILPVREHLAADYLQGAEYYQQRAFLEGTFAAHDESLTNTEGHTLCEVPFRIDRERGLVITEVPVYKWNSTPARVAPDLFLTTSYHVRDSSKFNYVYHTQTRTLASNGTGDLPVHRPDLVRRVVAAYSGPSVTGVSNNEPTLTPFINAQLDATQAEFQSVQSLVKWYIGIMPIVLSGTVRQTSFFGSVETGCFTIASLNTEWEPGLLRRRQRRLAAEADRQKVRRERMDIDERSLLRKGVVQ